MSTAKAWSNFAALQGALGTATYFGGFREVLWAAWFAIGLVWFTLLIYLFLLVNPATRTEARKRVPRISPWIAWPLDVAFVGAFLGAHWYMTALAYIAASIVYWTLLAPTTATE